MSIALIEIIGVCALILTIIGAVWQLSRHLTNIEVKLATLVGQTVTHDQCSTKRLQCPLVEDIKEIKQKLKGN